MVRYVTQCAVLSCMTGLCGAELRMTGVCVCVRVCVRACVHPC